MKLEIVQVGEVLNVDKLASNLRCRFSSLPMKYLGMPLGAHYKARNIWYSIIERM